MTDGPTPDESAPWERPRRWSTPPLEPTRVDDLLAKLGAPDEPADGRRARRATGDGQAVPASELLAAFEADDEPTQQVSPSSAVPADDDDATRLLSGQPASDEPTRALVGPQPDDAPTLLTHPAPDTVPPRVGPGDPAPIRDLSTDADEHTDVLPRIGAVQSAEAASILASLSAQSSGAAGHFSAGRFPAGSAGTAPGSSPAATGGGPGSKPPRRTGPPGGTSGGGRRRHPGWLYAGRSVIAIVAAVVLVISGWEWRILDRTASGLTSHHVSALYTQDPDIVQPTRTQAQQTAVTTTVSGKKTVVATTAAVAPVKMYSAENILLLGSDTRANGNGNSGNDNGNEDSAQSDTLMIAHLSADRQHVTILSIPRDTKVDAPSCNRWDYTTGKQLDSIYPTEAGDRWKITNAYAVGGPACTVKAVQKMTGLGITRWISIDFDGFKSMVDALGGITVDICKPIVDRVLQTVVPTAGVQTIRGDEALNLVRARDVIGDNLSDLARIHRQQIVLSSILRQVTSADTLLSPSKLDAFLQAFVKNTNTDNVTYPDLIELASSLGDLSPGKVTFYTLPTITDSVDPDALQPDPSKAPAVFDAINNDLILPGQTATPPKTTAASARTTTPTTRKPTASSAPAASQAKINVAPSAVQLAVYNLTGRAGVGDTAAVSLRSEGFSIAEADVVGPTEQTQDDVTVLYSPGYLAQALTVAAAVPGAVLRLDPSVGAQVHLLLGSSFSGTVTGVSVGQPVPSSLAATSAPTTSSTGATAAPAGSGAPAVTLRSTDLTSVNAGVAACA